MEVTSTVPGSMDHTLILKKLSEIKTAVDDGFLQLATKINEMGLKQKGGTRKKRSTRFKNKKII